MPLYNPSSGGTDDQIASEVPFTPVGGLSSTNVQAALQELDTEKGSSGGGSSAIAGTLSNATLITETIIASFALPAGHLAAGTVLNLRGIGQVSGTATLIFRVRIGAGLVTDTLVTTFTTTAAGVANGNTVYDILIHCLTAGAAGTVHAAGQIQLVSAVVGKATAAFAAATVDTTVARTLTLTVQQSVAQTYTSRTAVLDKVI